MIDNLLETDDLSHPMLVTREIKQTCYILVSSDRGLAGPYNSSVFRAFSAFVKENHPDGDFVVATIGHKAFSYAKRNKYNTLNKEAINVRDDIQFIDFKEITETFIKDYLHDRIDKIIVFYNHFINTITQNVEHYQLLPISKESDIEIKEGVKPIYAYEPDPQAIINHLLPMYVENTLYGIILDAKASEHASRMTAMKSATDNAEDLIQTLQLHYNRARQAAITVELTDIIGGANAVN
jgi:F-type H+-transporting ATPase subunit gamma